MRDNGQILGSFASGCYWVIGISPPRKLKNGDTKTVYFSGLPIEWDERQKIGLAVP